MNLKPIVDGFDTTLLLNNSIQASELFDASDPDGDTITTYTFSDSSSAGSSGFFVFQGVIQSNGTELTIDAGDLDELQYVAGSFVGNETISIQASDGTLFSEIALVKAYTARPESVRPVAAVDAIVILGNESVLASSFISAADPDGYQIESFMIRDRAVDKSFFSLDGQAVEQGAFRSYTAEEFSRLVYNAVGRKEENVDVFAFDGTVNSEMSTAVVDVRANLNRPVVDFAFANSIENEFISIADLINTSDADGNTIKTINLRDRNNKSFSGSLIFRGEELAPREFHSFTLDEIDEVFFRGGERNITEQVRVFVSDGRSRSFRNTISIENFSVNQQLRPQVKADNLEDNVASHLQFIAISDLFELANTADQFDVVSYEVFDGNLDSRSARLTLNGSSLQAGVVHTVTPDEFEGDDDEDDFDFGLNIETGTFEERQLDEIMVRAVNNSGVKGDWSRVNVRSEPEFSNSLFFFGIDWDLVYDAIGKTTDPIQLTYSFMQQFPNYETGEAIDAPDNDPPEPFIPFSPNQRESTRRALAMIESYANIEFVEVSDSIINDVSFSRGGTYRFGNYTLYDSEAAAFTWLPNLTPNAGDVWINTVSYPDYIDNVDEGSAYFSTLLHELGHTLGFDHSFVEVDGPQKPALPFSTESDQYTVMSYTGRSDGISPASFQLYDIYQIQELYGINENYATGDDLYSIANFVNGSSSALTIWDSAGNDTLSAAGSVNDSIVDLRPGGFSSIGVLQENISIAFSTEIENATGSGNDDMLFGNELANTITGQSGNDILRGFGGNDLLIGGEGADIFQFSVGDGDNRINDAQGAGRDRIEIMDFPGLNEFTNDLRFRLNGDDLVIQLTLDDNSSSIDTSITVEKQTTGAYRIETLSFGGNSVDLANLTSQATGAYQRFSITAESTEFGNLVVPV